ncbi:MAG: Crp/Fnr family transcriptional regulator [Anaerolineaceae bacterium]|nr:Crp/Fnr family transcriptional regulator [Anaerolineaceae bacterium]
MNYENAIEKFQKTINQQVAVPQSEWDYLIPHLVQRSFNKHEFLASDGDVIRNFYFILNGLVRFYYSTEEGKEFNKHFAMEDQFAGSFHSLVLQQPCGFFIQALEPTDTLVLPNKLLNELYLRHACWERLGRKNAETLLLIKEAREKEMLLDSLETRYMRFIKAFPGIADRLPQYHIASFLGVTNVALSRIRKKINLG